MRGRERDSNLTNSIIITCILIEKTQELFDSIIKYYSFFILFLYYWADVPNYQCLIIREWDEKYYYISQYMAKDRVRSVSTSSQNDVGV